MDKHIKKQVKDVMNITANYVEEMMGKLIKEIEKTPMTTFTKQEVVTILEVYSAESVRRIKESILLGK